MAFQDPTTKRQARQQTVVVLLGALLLGTFAWGWICELPFQAPLCLYPRNPFGPTDQVRLIQFLLTVGIIVMASNFLMKIWFVRR